MASPKNSFSSAAKNNAAARIQYHLFLHPLYENVADESREINVFLFGLGEYGREFLNAALQSGQLKDKDIRVTVLSDDIQRDREYYLSNRPSLQEFFSIDGAKVKDSYGSICFRQETFSDSVEENTELVEDILLQQQDIEQLNYVFVALGDDEINLSAALACKGGVSVLGGKCSIGFPATDPAVIGRSREEGLYPVEVNRPLSDEPMYHEIERMAFNAHLVWKQNADVSIVDEERRFKTRYNYTTSLSNILSMQSKLHSIGIRFDPDMVCDRDKLRDIADEFSRKGNDMIESLMWIEHRRWVVEKLCDGYSKLEVRDCPIGATHNKDTKKHICLVRSKPTSALPTDPEKWDKADTGTLDELDRVSLALHKKYINMAQELEVQRPLESNSVSLAAVRNLGKQSIASMAAYKEWENCMVDIYSGKLEAAVKYEQLKSNYCSAAGVGPASKEIIKNFEYDFLPFVERLKYTDFKQYDRDLVERIPFILTYDKDCTLIVPLKTDNRAKNHDAVFSCAVSSVIINPKRLILIAGIGESGEDQTPEDVFDAVQCIKELFSAKRLHTSITLVASAAAASVCTKLKRLGCIDDACIIRGAGENELLKGAADRINKLCADAELSALECNSKTAEQLLQTNALKHICSYRFDMSTAAFISDNGADVFRYIEKKCQLSVQDMAAFARSAGKSVRPEFDKEFDDLWKLYRDSSFAWKQLCKIFGKKANAVKRVEFRWDKPCDEACRYILPGSCYDTVKMLIGMLKNRGICGRDSGITDFLTSNSFSFVIKGKIGGKEAFDRLFSEPYLLSDINAWDIHDENDKKGQGDGETAGTRVTVAEAVNLKIEFPASKSPEKKPNSRVAKLIGELCRKGYLISVPIYRSDNNIPDRVYTFATPAIHHLLTVEGYILEIFLYHQLKKSGKFDDVANSFEINWGRYFSPKSEIDIVAVKGLASAIIECKAQTQLSSSFYKTHDARRKKERKKSTGESEYFYFGVNASYILVTDADPNIIITKANPNDPSKESKKVDPEDVGKTNFEIMKEAYNKYHIHTIYKKEERDHLPQTLEKILNGTYHADYEK